MPTLVLAKDQFSWIMSSVPQLLANYLNVPVDQSLLITTAFTLMMLVWVVKVCFASLVPRPCFLLLSVRKNVHMQGEPGNEPTVLQ